MDYEVRHIRREERPLLEDFLYEAVFVPEGFEGQIPRSVIFDDPKCRAAYLGFGTSALETSVPAKGMYLRRGYRVSGEETWQIAPHDGLPASLLNYETMVKELNHA